MVLDTQHHSDISPPAKINLEKLINGVDNVISNPETFLHPDAELVASSRTPACALYTELQSANTTSTVPEPDKLHVEGFDHEQIWQQFELKFDIFNEDSPSLALISKLITSSHLHLAIENDDELEMNSSHEESEASEFDSFGEDSDDEEIEGEEGSNDEFEDTSASEKESEDELGSDEKSDGEMANPGVKSEVDDGFFKLSEMDKFLKKQDDIHMRASEPSKAPLDELYISEDSEDPGYSYQDFYTRKNLTQQKQETGDDNSDKSARKKRFSIMNDDSDVELSDEEKELAAALDEAEGKVKRTDLSEDGESDGNGETDEEPGEDEGVGEDDEMDEGPLGANDMDEGAGSLDEGNELADRSEDDGISGEDWSGDEMSRRDKAQDEVAPEKKTSYERRNEKIQAQIKDFETKALLDDKPWQLRGEATAQIRPLDSLLQEDVDFDANMAPPPVITIETTQGLEVLIKQRIKDKAYDDVQRIRRNKDDKEKFRKRIELDQEKSQKSLSDVYEQEYLKLKNDNNGKEVEKDEPKEQIEKLMKHIFFKLDALADSRFTPKPALEEVSIVSTMPALLVEEAQPETLTDAARIAPQEMQRPKISVKERTELSETDKKSVRRKKKASLKKKAAKASKSEKPAKRKSKFEELAENLENIEQMVSDKSKLIKPSEKESVDKKTFSSSTEFFAALQGQVTNDRKSVKGKAGKIKKVTEKKEGIKASAFKL